MSAPSRGRGRARGRGARTQEEEVAPPGAEPVIEAPVAVGGGGRTVHRGPLSRPGGGDGDVVYSRQTEESAAQAAATAAGVVGGGRAAHRGQGEPRPGVTDVSAIERGISGMRVEPGAMGGAQAGIMTRRRGAILFVEPTTRPQHITDKRGTSGNAVSLVSNLFKMNRTTNFHLFQYHVSFNPEVPSKGMRKSMLKEHTNLTGGIQMFDGMILFLPIRLENESTEVFSVRKSDEARIQITIRFTNEIPPTSPTCLQLYNIIFKRILTQNKMKLIGRNYYNPDDSVKIPQHGLEVWPGFATSILQFETSTMLISDVSHKILHGVTALDAMYELYDRCRGGNFKEACAKKLIGQIVMTRYNNKTYRIDDINWEANPTTPFETEREGDVKYVDYYKKAYNIEIKDMKQPILLSMPKAKDKRRGQVRPIGIVPELCSLTGLADEVRADFNIMKDLAVHTRIGPSDRVKRLQKFITDINSNPLSIKELRDWNLEFSSNMLTMTGRHLPPEKIFQANQQMYTYNQDTADWSREMRGLPLLNPAHLTNWVLIYTNRDAGNASDLSSTLVKVCQPMGIRVNQPRTCQLPDDSTNTFVRALKESIDDSVCMIVVILPTNRKDRYDAIKTICCVELPVPSQVVLSRTLSKKQMLMSVATKIAIQLNVKMGGEVWALDIPIKNVMIVGIDTYHDSAKKGRSVGAFIASMNSTFTRYYSRCAFQSSHEELQNALTICMQAALQQYHAVNGVLPEKVIVFRDGVGDGQLATVHEHEVRQLTECFHKLGPDYVPKFAVIVVKKRINSRFFMMDKGQYTNPRAGTVVDTEATRPEWYDFFLVSQSVRQGTVAPTHYNVIYDTTGLKPDHMQRLAYKLCHLYYNWQGTIRVPAPCQYAHKMAFLVGQSLHRDPSLKLADKLFFL